MAYSLNPSSDNCYEGTTCLVNKLGIRDEKRLSEVEAQITFAKAVMLEETPIDDVLASSILRKSTNFCYVICMNGRGKCEPLIFRKRERSF